LLEKEVKTQHKTSIINKTAHNLVKIEAKSKFAFKSKKIAGSDLYCVLKILGF